MRKALGYGVIFVLGFVVCVVMLKAFGGLGVAREGQARRVVLTALEKQPAGALIPDTALVKAAAKIEPAVVNIDVLSTGTARSFDFFGAPVERQFAQQGKGSGVIISPDGYIVTNNHVVAGATIIRVTTTAGKQYDGRIIGADPNADLAVVKVDAANLPSAEIGDSSRLKVGEYVLAIGYPLGIGTTVTHGIISATDRRDLEIGEGHTLKQAIQTDAPINRGNSGGALSNLAGQLIGINTAIVSENGGGNIGIGFAIPMNAARGILRDLIAHGRATPAPPSEPFMGIQYFPLDPEAAGDFGLQPGQGVVVRGVVPLTSAANAGIAPRDVLTTVDGRPINTPDDVRDVISRKRVGDSVALGVVHSDGRREEVKLTLGRRPQLSQ